VPTHPLSWLSSAAAQARHQLFILLTTSSEEQWSREGRAITMAAAATATATAATASPPDDSTSLPIDAEQDFDGVKARLANDKERQSELRREIDRACDECDAEIARARGVRDAFVERAESEYCEMRDRMGAAERAIAAVVNAPVSGGRDPFTWLPDELLVMVLVMLSGVTLWSGACERVCQRWARLMQSPLVKRRMRAERWAGYEEGVIQPRELHGHESTVTAIALGLDDKIYTASFDSTIRVWSAAGGAHLQTLLGHTDKVFALAVGLDGVIYSGSNDKTVRVWSGADGSHLQTLQGHTHSVRALAVGLDGKVYVVPPLLFI
jgi:hypothetical protein